MGMKLMFVSKGKKAFMAISASALPCQSKELFPFIDYWFRNIIRQDNSLCLIEIGANFLLFNSILLCLEANKGIFSISLCLLFFVWYYLSELMDLEFDSWIWYWQARLKYVVSGLLARPAKLHIASPLKMNEYRL